MVATIHDVQRAVNFFHEWNYDSAGLFSKYFISDIN